MKAAITPQGVAGQPPRRRKSAAKFLYDEKGRKSHVLLDIKLYEQLLYELEMAEDVQAYREAIARNEPTVSWEDLKREMADEATSDTPLTAG